MQGMNANVRSITTPSLACQAPLLAWVTWETFLVTSDRRFLARSYPVLAAHVKWILAHRDADGDGLLEYANGRESAMDNSPVFRVCRPSNKNCTAQARRDNLSSWNSPDLSTWVANEMKHLCLMANALNNREAGVRPFTFKRWGVCAWSTLEYFKILGRAAGSWGVGFDVLYFADTRTCDDDLHGRGTGMMLRTGWHPSYMSSCGMKRMAFITTANPSQTQVD